jgi:hypothetical protein
MFTWKIHQNNTQELDTNACEWDEHNDESSPK